MSSKEYVSIVMILNYYSHHQTELSEALYRETHGNYIFIETEPMEEERKTMGWGQEYLPPFVKQSYTSEEDKLLCLKLCENADVVIIGSAPDIFIQERMKRNKLTFRYHERFFKEGRWHILDPRVLWHQYNKSFKLRNKNLYMLCASAYTAPDCRFIHSYPNKTYKWGYFPKIKQPDYSKVLSLKQKNDKIKILWASRFIKLKHPEDIIRLARKLKNDNINFEVEMLGIGELRQEYENIAKDNKLENVINFTGPFSPEEVLGRMQCADIFLFTSDRNEGWGAVLNEAMSVGCAVVANREIGSVPYLIKDGKNGLVYNRKDKDSLYRCVRKLIDDRLLREELGKCAYDTIKTVWNADIAAERLLHLVNCINNGTPVPYVTGPCSRD